MLKILNFKLFYNEVPLNILHLLKVKLDFFLYFKDISMIFDLNLLILMAL
jgi:hypothetical protein